MITSWRKASLILLAFLGTATDACAEGWLYFRPMRGEVSLEFDGQWRDLESGVSSFDTEFEERLRLDISGDVLDQKIFTFNVDIEPVLTQNWTDTGLGTERNGATDMNYGGRVSFLHGVQASPFSLDADFSRTSSDVDGTLGSRSKITRDGRGAALHWKLSAFPSTLSYREFKLDELFVPAFGLPPTERDEFQRTMSFRGRSRKMEVVLEGIDFDDRTPLDNDYKSQDARLNNNFRWGKGSSLTSRLSYFNRDGFNAYKKSAVSESVKLQHTRNLYTTYGFTGEVLERTTETRTRRGDFGVHHQLYRNLTTSLAVSRFDTDSDAFQEDRTDGLLDFYYNKRFSDNVRVSANLGGGYRVVDRVGGQLDYFESPTVPVTGIVVLAQRFIIVSTIVVTAPGCNPCLETTDYIVQDAGNDFTQLQIPIGSRINIGDVLTVDYVFESPSVDYHSVPYRFGVRLDYGAYALYHRTTGEEQTLVAGSDPNAVADRRIDTTGVEWIWTWDRNRDRNRASVTAERVFTDTAGRITTEYTLRQTLNYAVARATTLTANLKQSRLIGETNVTVYEGDAMINWRPVRGIIVTPNTSAFHRVSDPGGTEDYLQLGVDFGWRWRRLTFDAKYDHYIRNTESNSQIEDRLILTVKRKF